MDRRPLTVAILTGMDSPWIAETIASLARRSEVRLVGVLVDTEPAPFGVRLRNLRRNVRRQGLSYAWHRLGTALAGWIEDWLRASSRNPTCRRYSNERFRTNASASTTWNSSIEFHASTSAA